jgi:DNA-binding MarR family transcriptional regulator
LTASYPIKIWSGLLSDGHTQKIENALWEFIWLINKVTKEENGSGLVLKGKPIKVEEISEDLKRTYKTVWRNLKKLETGGYINLKRCPYGFVITVNNSKKFAERVDKNVQSRYDKNVQNKEDIKHIYKTDIYSILDFWNEQKIITHEPKEDMLNQILIGIKKYGIDKIKLAITRYKEILDSDFYYSYKWRLDKFLKQSNGVPNFLDDGSIWVNYNNRDTKKTDNELYNKAYKCYKDFQGGWCQNNYDPGNPRCQLCKQNKDKWKKY